MDMREFELVKNMSYEQYCDYLQEKYGIGVCDYFTANWSPKSKCKRTKEGLFAHHKAEVYVPQLSKKEQAKSFPFEWQTAEWIVYCDYLEHLLLHIMICKDPKPVNSNFIVGLGGIINFLVPQINDMYAGLELQQEWRQICFAKIAEDKTVYLELLKMFYSGCLSHEYICPDNVLNYIVSVATVSENMQSKNFVLFQEILNYILPKDEELSTYLMNVFKHAKPYKVLTAEKEQVLANYVLKFPQVDKPSLFNIIQKLIDGEHIDRSFNTALTTGRNTTENYPRWVGWWRAWKYKPGIEIIHFPTYETEYFEDIDAAVKQYPGIQLTWYKHFKK